MNGDNLFARTLLITTTIVMFNLTIASNTYSEEETTTKKQKNFILKLNKEKKYPEFVLESERYLYFNDSDEDKSKFLYLKGLAYFKMNRMDEALADLDALTANYKNHELFVNSLLLKQKIYFGKDKFSESIDISDEIFKSKGGDELKAESLWYKVASLIEIKDYERAKIDSKILLVNFNGGGRKENAEEIDSNLNECCNFGTRDERIALALSIVPGAGHIYLGEYFTGAAFFLLTGLFTTASIFSIKEGNIPESFIWAPIGLSFYISSFYDSYKGAINFTENKEMVFLNELRELYPPFIKQ